MIAIAGLLAGMLALSWIFVGRAAWVEMQRRDRIRKLAGLMLSESPQDDAYAHASDKIMSGVGSTIDGLFKELSEAYDKEGVFLERDRHYQFPMQRRILAQIQALLPETVRAWNNLTPPEVFKDLHIHYARWLQAAQDYAVADEVALKQVTGLMAGTANANKTRDYARVLHAKRVALLKRHLEYHERLKEFGLATKIALASQEKMNKEKTEAAQIVPPK